MAQCCLRDSEPKIRKIDIEEHEVCLQILVFDLSPHKCEFCTVLLAAAIADISVPNQQETLSVVAW